ncbi:unnamed protein product [Parnassius apollo]|uniref:(apollo) hypothetical protein n=1 Tax=Parnassius apollo TaxID=110799 RepID=A0A8S3W131_PARAO|nr:unnamed protein product [Parnassius apollo]
MLSGSTWAGGCSKPQANGRYINHSGRTDGHNGACAIGMGSACVHYNGGVAEAHGKRGFGEGSSSEPHTCAIATRDDRLSASK